MTHFHRRITRIHGGQTAVLPDQGVVDRAEDPTTALLLARTSMWNATAAVNIGENVAVTRIENGWRVEGASASGELHVQLIEVVACDLVDHHREVQHA